MLSFQKLLCKKCYKSQIFKYSNSNIIVIVTNSFSLLIFGLQENAYLYKTRMYKGLVLNTWLTWPEKFMTAETVIHDQVITWPYLKTFTCPDLYITDIFNSHDLQYHGSLNICKISDGWIELKTNKQTMTIFFRNQ